MLIVLLINQKDYWPDNANKGFYFLNSGNGVLPFCYFQQRSCSHYSVLMNLIVPSLKSTQPPLGLWLSKVKSSGPPCCIEMNKVSPDSPRWKMSMTFDSSCVLRAAYIEVQNPQYNCGLNVITYSYIVIPVRLANLN